MVFSEINNGHVSCNEQRFLIAGFWCCHVIITFYLLDFVFLAFLSMQFWMDQILQLAACHSLLSRIWKMLKISETQSYFCLFGNAVLNRLDTVASCCSCFTLSCTSYGKSLGFTKCNLVFGFLSIQFWLDRVTWCCCLTAFQKQGLTFINIFEMSMSSHENIELLVVHIVIVSTEKNVFQNVFPHMMTCLYGGCSPECVHICLYCIYAHTSVCVHASVTVCMCVQRPCASPLYNEIMRVSEAGEARAGHPTDRN